MSTAAVRDQHLDDLRALMAAHSPPLHALLVPSEDAHQSEYVSERDKRRQFISGFTGSAGLVLITTKEALLWTDGRYFLQATQQLSDRWKLMRMGEDPLVEVWIADNLPDEAVIGIDPWCISVDSAQRYEQTFSKKRQTLFQLSADLVDEIWKDRPPTKPLPVIVHPVEFAGRSVAEKIKELREKLQHEKASAIIITALDEVAWLYNIRGDDVHYSPVVHSYAIVTLHSAFFYVDKRKVTAEVQNYMTENGIDIREYNMVQSDVSLLVSGQLNGSAVNGSSHGVKDINEVEHSQIWIDSNSCCFALYSKLSADQVLMLQSPIAFPKAVKNPVELDGLRKAHIRDGAAIVQYLSWLDNQMQENYGASGYFSEANGSQKKELLEIKLTEVSVSDKLEGFRATKEHFKGLSFPTISSVGPNAAIIHYSPEASTCAELDADKIYLCDSGAQYLDGTTDITRTVHFGKPSEHEKSCYTAVLKGHIALDAAVFPNGTTGHALDILARTPLWKDGLDYRHGTGHGIGSYLNVHEGPHLISFRPSARNVLRPPYTHLASPITMSSPATAAASSPASVPASSPASAMPRGGVTIGLPAQPRGAQTPVGYTGFVPPPSLAHQFGSMHRGPDQPPPSSAQLRQPAPGIQNIGMIGSLNASQMRPPAISSPQQPRPGLPSSTTPSPSGNQMPGSQKTPTHALARPLSMGFPSPSTALQQIPPNVSSPFRPQQRPQVTQPRPYHVPQSAPAASHQQNILSAQKQQQQQQQQSQPQHSSQQSQQNTTLKNQQQIYQQQAARTPLSMAQKPDSPATLQATNMQLVDMASIDVDAGESGNRLLSKRSIHELVAQIDPSEKLDPEVEDVLIDIAEDFVESVATFACSLAKHRKANTLEAKDILLHAERSWNITLPGFGGDEIKLYKKPHVNDIHRERLTLIKKSMASEGNTKSSGVQTAANQKNQTPKPPATGSP